MTTLLLARHGETDWNAQRRWQGHADIPLNDRGRAQASTLAEQLAAEGVDAIYTSDLRRAQETAEIVASRLNVPVFADPDLREIDVGSREGLVGEAGARRVWDGESKDAHRERTLRALRRIVDRHPRRRVVVITHGGTLRRVHEQIGLEPQEVANCTVWGCAYEDGAFRALE